MFMLYHLILLVSAIENREMLTSHLVGAYHISKKKNFSQRNSQQALLHIQTTFSKFVLT